MVVVPSLLTTRAALEEQIERLEIHYLASPEGELYFALLSDWTDAPTENAPGDETLLAMAGEAIARLNRLHGKGSAGDRFLLLHRRRVWSDVQRQWMGWERKRGKLHELNRLLRGATDTNFHDANRRPPEVPSGVRYVITLDADTRLPRETARRLVGKMAHPLNHPRFDAATGRVVEGYAVLQPRVAPSLPVGREGSIFQRVFSSASGIDPYAAAVSDVYQDLFGEGSYAGKGIYDVDAFEAALAGRVSDGTLLSHDLFEGIFARAGLVSDIEVVEEFPSRYDVAAARQHRWARGDWQLLPWILGRGDAAGATRGSRSLPLIGRWKMLDNLRRTLVGARQCRGPAGRMDVAPEQRAGLDRLCRTDDRLAGATPDFRRHRAAPPRRQATQPPPSAPKGYLACCVPDRLPHNLSCASGMVDDRRDQSNAVSSDRESTEPAPVGHRSSGEPQVPA